MNILKWLFKNRTTNEPELPEQYKCKLKCDKCGSRNVNIGSYTRGYDKKREQACGDKGCFCNRCRHITFEKTFEEYKKSLPSWYLVYW